MKRFLVRDESGRGWACEYSREDFNQCGGWDMSYSNDPDDEFTPTLGEWLNDSEAGEEYNHEDENLTIICIG